MASDQAGRKSMRATGAVAREPQSIRILVVDDHPVVRHGIVSTLRTQGDFAIVGEAGSCAEASSLIGELAPDVVVLDLEMEDVSGAEALTRIRQHHPRVPVIVYSAYEDEPRLAELVQASAQGFLKKRSPLASLFEGIRVVASGGSFFDPEVALRVMNQLGLGQEAGAGRSAELTERERAVLKLIAQGKRNKEISRALFISECTVKFHVSAMLSKLQAGNRTQAVHIAASRGLIQL